MFSPESLTLLGNSAGQTQASLPVYLIFFAALSLASSMVIHHPALPRQTNREVSQLSAVIGRTPATTLLLSGRLTMVSIIPTALLVTAGFTFNEVFLYWFPNFGFAFGLLGLVLLVQLLPKPYREYFQLSCSGIVVLAMASLIFFGLANAGAVAIPPAAAQVTFSWPSAFAPLLLFLGYDHFNSQTPKTSLTLALMFIGITTLYVLWAWVSLRYITPTILAHSSIAPMLVGKKIAGQPGRLLIGVAVIAGTLAAVNGLFTHAVQSLKNLRESGYLPRLFKSDCDNTIYPILFAAVIGLMMASGLAGKKELEMYLRGSLLLWLLHHCGQCFAAGWSLLAGQIRVAAITGICTSAALFAGMLVLLFTYPQRQQLLLFCTFIVLFFFLVSLLGRLTQTNHPNHPFSKEV